MSHLKATTPRDFLAGFDQSRPIDEQEVNKSKSNKDCNSDTALSIRKKVQPAEPQKLPLLTCEMNSIPQLAREVQNIFTVALNKEVADLKSRGFVPVHSGNLRNMAAMWTQD
jgi:hypothetical protein